MVCREHELLAAFRKLAEDQQDQIISDARKAYEMESSCPSAEASDLTLSTIYPCPVPDS